MDIRARILELLKSPNYRPLRRSELARALRFKDEERREFRHVLRELMQKGEIVRVRKNRFVLPQEADLVVGRISMNERGFGFVVPEAGEDGVPAASGDIYIAAEDTWTAMHGDSVVVRLIHGSTRRDRAGKTDKLAGRVIRILQRANVTVVGTLQKTKWFTYIVPDDPRLIHDIYVKPKQPVRVGDKVVVKLDEWKSRHVNPEGEIVEVLGPSEQPGVDILAIIRKHHLATTFPDDVLREVERYGDSVTAQDIEGRRDLRQEFIVTIDPDDAKDFDDAISVEERPDGSWRLGVHIADVSHYVRPNTALDREAASRGNSVYLVDRVLPMLPEKLSINLCSLRPQEDRLTQSAFIEFNARGGVKKAEFDRTVIRSRHRLTYKKAFALLQQKTAPHDGETKLLHAELHKAWRLASLLRKLRFERGSLDLDFPEVKVWLDAKGKPERIEKVENDISHQLIEEFMLAANEAVAKFIRDRNVPGIYRIHEDPAPEKLEEFRAYLHAMGIQVGNLGLRGEIQKLLQRVKDHPQAYVIKLNLLKSLKRAMYAPKPVGHYGLAKANYTHFTSPIRRYPDLLVHRILVALVATADRSRERKRVAAGPLAHARSYPVRGAATATAGFYHVDALKRLAEHCSLTERKAAEAEDESKKLKILEFFHGQLHRHKLDAFDAVVTEVRNFGMFVELLDTLTYGLVHVSTLDDDFYAFDETRQRFIGKHTRKIYKAGDRVKVEVSRVDVFKKQIDFRIAGD
jgi:ribonuclease R